MGERFGGSGSHTDKVPTVFSDFVQELLQEQDLGAVLNVE